MAPSGAHRPLSPRRHSPASAAGLLHSGPFTRPPVSRNATEGHTLLVILLPDAVQALTGLDPAACLNRNAPVEDAMAADWSSTERGKADAAWLGRAATSSTLVLVLAAFAPGPLLSLWRPA